MSHLRISTHRGDRVASPHDQDAANAALHETLMPHLDRELRSGMRPFRAEPEAGPKDGVAGCERNAHEAHQAHEAHRRHPAHEAHVRPKARGDSQAPQTFHAPGRMDASASPHSRAVQPARPPAAAPAPSVPARVANSAKVGSGADAASTVVPSARSARDVRGAAPAHTSPGQETAATAAPRAPQVAVATTPTVVSKAALTKPSTAAAATPAPAAASAAAATAGSKPTPSRSTTTSVQETASRATTSAGINLEVPNKAEDYSKESAGLGVSSTEDLMQTIRDLAKKEVLLQSEMGLIQLSTKMNEAVAKTIKTTGESIKGVAG